MEAVAVAFCYVLAGKGIRVIGVQQLVLALVTRLFWLVFTPRLSQSSLELFNQIVAKSWNGWCDVIWWFILNGQPGDWGGPRGVRRSGRSWWHCCVDGCDLR